MRVYCGVPELRVAPWATLRQPMGPTAVSVRAVDLLQACVRTCDAHASGRERSLAVVLPCLARGLSSPVAEVRQTRWVPHPGGDGRG